MSKKPVRIHRCPNGNKVVDGVLVLDERWLEEGKHGEFVYHSDGLSVLDSVGGKKVKRFTHSVLRNGLLVDWNLNLTGSNIRRLPRKLVVYGNCFLSGTRVHEMPEMLFVLRSLILSHTPVERLPDNLKVGGNLDLSNTNVTHLPKKLRVKGHLILLGAPVVSIPEDIRVDGCIVCSPEQVKRIPSKLFERRRPAKESICDGFKKLAMHYFAPEHPTVVVIGKAGTLSFNLASPACSSKHTVQTECSDNRSPDGYDAYIPYSIEYCKEVS